MHINYYSSQYYFDQHNSEDLRWHHLSMTHYVHPAPLKTPDRNVPPKLWSEQDIRGKCYDIVVYLIDITIDRWIQVVQNSYFRPSSLLLWPPPVLEKTKLYRSSDLRRVVLSTLSHSLKRLTNIFFQRRYCVAEFTSWPSGNVHFLLLRHRMFSSPTPSYDLTFSLSFSTAPFRLLAYAAEPRKDCLSAPLSKILLVLSPFTSIQQSHLQLIAIPPLLHRASSPLFIHRLILAALFKSLSVGWSANPSFNFSSYSTRRPSYTKSCSNPPSARPP